MAIGDRGPYAIRVVPPSERQELGERLGVGRTAEVFAWRDGTVIKLLRREFPDRMAENEAAIASVVTAAGLAAPDYLGSELVDGRVGLVYERVVGPSMLDRLKIRPWWVDAAAHHFAELHAQMHHTAIADVPDYATSIRGAIDEASAVLGAERANAAIRQMDRLDSGAALCHGDMHPGNVMMTAAGPLVIDWLAAGSGPAHADVARTLFLLRGSAIPRDFPRLQRAALEAIRRRFARTYLRAYGRLRPLDAHQVAQWNLPILAARVAEAVEGEREMLLTAIDAEMRR
jgi:hypothetical protein